MIPYSVTNIEGIQDSDAVANFFCLNEPPHTYKDVDSQRVRTLTKNCHNFITRDLPGDALVQLIILSQLETLEYFSMGTEIMGNHSKTIEEPHYD